MLKYRNKYIVKIYGLYVDLQYDESSKFNR